MWATATPRSFVAATGVDSAHRRQRAAWRAGEVIRPHVGSHRGVTAPTTSNRRSSADRPRVHRSAMTRTARRVGQTAGRRRGPCGQLRSSPCNSTGGRHARSVHLPDGTTSASITGIGHRVPGSTSAHRPPRSTGASKRAMLVDETVRQLWPGPTTRTTRSSIRHPSCPARTAGHPSRGRSSAVCEPRGPGTATSD